MSNAAKLKKRALELEQKKQLDKALALYIQFLQESDGSIDDVDIPLYNRVGDLLLRTRSASDALDYYEKAVDLYAELGFLNHAIALCNKVLRQSPGRASIYYKLGKISASKGFKSDAKKNFLEYADRMQKTGQIDEAFRALKEFADLCPDQDDIRLMLAEQLAKKQRNGEALEQLQVLYEKFEVEGRQAEARATMDRMKAIDPAAEPKTGTGNPKPKAGDLVFLEVNFDDGPKTKVPKRNSGGRAVTEKRPIPPIAPPPKAPPPSADLPFLDISDDIPAAAAPEPIIEQASIEPSDVEQMGADPSATGFQPSIDTSFSGDSLLGLETTQMSPDVVQDQPPGALLDLEPTALGRSGITHDDLNTDFGISPLDDSASLSGDLLAGGELVELELSETEAETPAPPEHDLALPGELPTLAAPDERTSANEPALGGDLELIMPDESASPSRSARALEDLEAPIARGESRRNGAFDLPMLDMDEPAVTPAPSRAPAGANDPLAALRARVGADSGNPSLRRQLAEALFERGSRDEGLGELEMAMIGFERQNDLESASSVADEIIRLNPNSVRHHQKRVEYAFRTNDRNRLVDAYLELADALFRSAQPEKARTVYQRVLELSPDDVRAQAALSTFIEAPSAPPAAPPRKAPAGTPERSGVFRRYTGEAKRQPDPEPPPARAAASASSDDGFVNLGDWLKNETPKNTRMVVQEQAPTGDEQADFADMLRRFKQGVAENVEDEDHQSHYDLGVAFKEMGLLDEAIAEFQKALRGVENRVRTYEALGQCFLEKSQFPVAATLLGRALSEPNHSDEQLVGVLYLLGYCHEAMQKWGDALAYYQRVFAVDIEFRDVSDRISALERVAT